MYALLVKIVKRLILKSGVIIMNETNEHLFIKEAKISQKGQITIPREIRELLGVELGEKIVFYVDKDKQVRVLNSKKIQVKI